MVDTYDALRATVALKTLDTFGQSATYTPIGGGAASTVKVWLGTTIEESFNDSGAYIVETRETVTCLRAEVTDCLKGDTFLISGTTYTVEKIIDARTPHKWQAIVSD